VLALVIVGTLSACSYLLLSKRLFGLGFPLDDAWIHQTYARNLISTGQWAFTSGEPSGGSTAPLWTLMLTPGYILGLDHRLWSYLLGVAQLILIAWVSMKWLSHRLGESPRSLWILSALVIFEWHLVWASLSGMETISLALLALAVLYWLEAAQKPHYFAIGAAIGLGVWLRPDALVLLAPVAWCLYWSKIPKARNRFGSVLLGLLATFIPYLLFNFALSGEIWPNTLFAKQAEYAGLRTAPFWLRLVRMMGFPLRLPDAIITEAGGPLVGVAALLIPGLLLDLKRIIKARAWQDLSPYLWIGGMLFAYAWRLPATYQHGRYAIPVIPVWIALGFLGALQWLAEPAPNMLSRVARRAWVLSTLIVLGIFWLRGGVAYSQDVAVIESEMVVAAEWIDRSTDPDAVIAAHDIGALGYFAERELLDLAGLVSPEVVAFIRDEDRLMNHIQSKQADYLVTFPGFYSPAFTQDLDVVFKTESDFSRRLGGENMVVYRLES
jgi:hypothetical protein